MSYSQNKEEQIILSYFRDNVGIFLDLGAYDGVQLSNTRALAERNWQGVMVEASPTVFEKLETNYDGFPLIELHNCCVSWKTDIMEFWNNDNAVATLHEHEASRWGETQAFESIEVPCYEINEFLDKCKYNTFDFISCDIEGEDLNVISRINFKKLQTRMLCVEYNGKDLHLYNEILRPYNFRLIHRNAENLIFTR